jgi:hypothetical protein
MEYQDLVVTLALTARLVYLATVDPVSLVTADLVSLATVAQLVSLVIAAQLELLVLVDLMEYLVSQATAVDQDTLVLEFLATVALVELVDTPVL